MARFSGSYEETFTVDVPIEKAKAHFGDLDMIVSCYPSVQRSEKLDDKTLRLELVPQSAMGVTFAGKYDVKYEFTSENVLIWKTVGSGANIFADGRAEFSSLGESKTRIVYRDKMDCEIPINRLLGKAIAPIVNRDVSNGVKEYLNAIRSKL